MAASSRWTSRLLLGGWLIVGLTVFPAFGAEDDEDKEVEEALRKQKEKLAAQQAERAKAAEEKSAGAKAAVKPTAAAATPPPAPAIPAVCAECAGTKLTPILPPRPYAQYEGEPGQKPEGAVQWKHCSKCAKEKDPKALLQEIVDRHSRSLGRNESYEGRIKEKLTLVETPYVALHTMEQPAAAREAVKALDELNTLILSRTRSTVLLSTRPDVDEILIFTNDAGYNNLIDSSNSDNKDLAKKVTGICGPHMEAFKIGAKLSPVRSRVLYSMGHLLMDGATNGKSPIWLKEGFAAYCENAVAKTNYHSTMAYEMNDIKIGPNWNAELGKYGKKGELKPWDHIFGVNLIGMKPLEYLTCYSMVSFLFQNDAVRFNKMVVNLREGMDSPKAIEAAYGRSIKDLQVMWAQWALMQK